MTQAEWEYRMRLNNNTRAQLADNAQREHEQYENSEIARISRWFIECDENPKMAPDQITLSNYYAQLDDRNQKGMNES